jgi:hypothetical protein
VTLEITCERQFWKKILEQTGRFFSSGAQRSYGHCAKMTIVADKNAHPALNRSILNTWAES